ncbi:uncharacterized protein LOC143361562 [Halictus rubicundus]|uniref:uncharacterized protein LOC143361562 n=1 Tax=Halictus rubicundus TaxID=77578 RepID=UPI004036926B
MSIYRFIDSSHSEAIHLLLVKTAPLCIGGIVPPLTESQNQYPRPPPISRTSSEDVLEERGPSVLFTDKTSSMQVSHCKSTLLRIVFSILQTEFTRLRIKLC